MFNLAKTILVFITVFITTYGCQSHPKKDSAVITETTKPVELNICNNPRPQMCTREYRPVCADVDTGVRCIKAPCPSTKRKIYSNTCTACSDSKVYGYKLGACKL